jgi:hypothetical protein
MLKLHKLFLNAGHALSFDEVIEPTPTQWQTLVDAKNAIRDHLRASLRAASTQLLGMDRQIGPRFRSQGSCVYRTLIQPAHAGQEMDWDFGVYLPVEIMDARPKTAAKTYFDLVEAALDDLCKKRRWSLDRTKKSCVRVNITPWAHIDVPLYAVPASEFHTIQERARATAQLYGGTRDSKMLSESVDFAEMPEPFWQLIEGVHLATRAGEWVKTDPEEVARWYNDRVEQHGEQLRRVCRYVKGWRDYYWPNCVGPSSVSLMILVARNFVARSRRDDLALEDAARVIYEGIGQDIYEPGIDGGEVDFNRLDATQRKLAKALAKDLLDQLWNSRHYGSLNLARDAIRNVRSQLGSRIADDTSFIELDDSTDLVRRSTAAAVAPPLVGSNQSG